jgi:hypothetical protein
VHGERVYSGKWALRHAQRGLFASRCAEHGAVQARSKSAQSGLRSVSSHRGICAIFWSHLVKLQSADTVSEKGPVEVKGAFAMASKPNP